MIIFLGDSFTWGQGLYSKKWIQEGKSIEYCNQHLPPTFSHENISYSDDVYRRTHHFPNLVAKHYDRSYYCKPKNGGSNNDIFHITREIYSICTEAATNLVIIQFTEFLRDLNYKIPNESINLEKFIEEECKSQINSIYNSLKQNNVSNFIFFSWRGDIGNILKKDYNEYYVPLYYKNKEYVCFGDMLKQNSELELAGELGVNDGHLSELGHTVIADSIIKKVDTMGIDFKRPK
jgi:lysophospholipase L1-like esterase